jgi:hypothetical protein
MYIEESYLESEFLENFLSISFLESLLSPIEYINAYNKRLLRKHVPEINLGI